MLRLAAASGLTLAGAALAGCGALAGPQATATPASRLLVPTPAPGQLVGVLPASDLAVGPNNRFLLGLLDDRNRPISDARVQLRFFRLTDEKTAQARGDAVDAPFRSSPQLGDKGLYVARATFDEAGSWGVEVRTTRSDGTSQTLRLPFEVRAESRTPAIGSPAPASQTATATAPAETEKICSARPVDEFHRLSVADALARRKPLLVLFATPGFCPSRTCGPDLEVVQAATGRLGDRLNVIHVEIYKDAQPPDLVPAVAEWNLPSEPWVFLVSADGRIVDKFEGGVTVEELEPAVAQLVAS